MGWNKLEKNGFALRINQKTETHRLLLGARTSSSAHSATDAPESLKTIEAKDLFRASRSRRTRTCALRASGARFYARQTFRSKPLGHNKRGATFSARLSCLLLQFAGLGSPTAFKGPRSFDCVACATCWLLRPIRFLRERASWVRERAC